MQYTVICISTTFWGAIYYFGIRVSIGTRGRIRKYRENLFGKINNKSTRQTRYARRSEGLGRRGWGGGGRTRDLRITVAQLNILYCYCVYIREKKTNSREENRIL